MIRDLRDDFRNRSLQAVHRIAGEPRPGRAITWVGDLQQGDGGKGAMTDRLAPYHQLVVRVQGGDNAGHTTVFRDEDDDRVVLKNHILPSGLRHSGTMGVLGNGVLINADKLHQEVQQMEQRIPGIRERVLISGRAHLILPLHIEVDGQQEDAQNGRSVKIGTTRRGIGPANISKLNRIGIRVWDLRDMSRVKQRIKDNIEFFGVPDSKLENSLDYVAEHRDFLLTHAIDSVSLIRNAAEAGYSILFEGAQGPLIDPEHGIYPYVTTCPTAVYSVASGSGLDVADIDNRIGVLKVYQTMVGNGAFVTEDHGEHGASLRRLGDEFGTTTDRPRRCGWLDLVHARWAVEVNRYTSVVLTKLDVLDNFEEVGVCIAYELNGQIVADFVPEHDSLLDCKPIYKFFPGWCSSTAGRTRYGELPEAARSFVDFVEDYLGKPVSAVTTGPSDSDIAIKDPIGFPAAWNRGNDDVSRK